MRKKDTSWNEVAGWYDSLLNGEGTYQKEVILPNLLRLLDIKKGEWIFDIACGQGFFSRAFEKSGANVVGLDISPELIALAKKSAPNDAYFHVGSSDNISFEKDGSFDKAVCILALQNIENLSGTLQEVSRILKTGGKLFLVLNHPAFRNPKHTAWAWDEKEKIQYRRVDEYLSESKTEIDMSPGQAGKNLTVSFHRSLQAYFKALNKAGFLVGRLEEWNSNKKSEVGPRQKAEDKARREIPLFLLIEAVKTQPPRLSE
jgi:ubiquinone/menaquinone biosynthesis C-methylase UbiE